MQSIPLPAEQTQAKTPSVTVTKSKTRKRKRPEKQKDEDTCPLSLEPIPAQRRIRVRTSNKFQLYDVEYLWKGLEQDDQKRDPLTRQPYSSVQLRRIRNQAIKVGVPVTHPLILQCEKHLSAIFEITKMFAIEYECKEIQAQIEGFLTATSALMRRSFPHPDNTPRGMVHCMHHVQATAVDFDNHMRQSLVWHVLLATYGINFQIIDVV